MHERAHNCKTVTLSRLELRNRLEVTGRDPDYWVHLVLADPRRMASEVGHWLRSVTVERLDDGVSTASVDERSMVELMHPPIRMHERAFRVTLVDVAPPLQRSFRVRRLEKPVLRLHADRPSGPI